MPVNFSGGLDGKAYAYNEGDPGSIPGSGRSPGKGNGNPLQYSCLENPMDGGTWQAIVHRTGKGQFSFHSQRKAMTKNVQTNVHCTPFTH